MSPALCQKVSLSTHHLSEVVPLRHVSDRRLAAPLLPLGDPDLAPGQDVEGVPYGSLPGGDISRLCSL